MKKFILIDHEPWIKNSKTFLNPFEEAHIPHEVWNISGLVHKNLIVDNSVNMPEGSKSISDINEFISCLDSEDCSNLAIIEYFPRIWSTRKILKELSIRKVPSIRIENYGNCFSPKIPYVNQILHLSIKELFYKIISKSKHCLFELYTRYNKIPPRLFVLSSNATQFRTHAYNNPDYENYRFNNQLPIIQSDYLVFCDIYFPYHPDIQILYGSKYKMTGEHYYYLMNKVFATLEDKYKIPVIIAAHPKSDYRGDEFNGRKIIKYQTNNLVCNSKGVILHQSASLSYTILYDKPLILINIDDFNVYPILRNIVKRQAEFIGHDYYDINSDFNDWDTLKLEKINENIRHEYIYKYLTSRETENIPNYITLKRILSSL